jgi:hypothetical protein
MHYPDDAKSIHQQTTIPMPQLTASTPQLTASTPQPPVANPPTWPPPPRARPSQGISWRLRVSGIVLATVLVFGGLGLLIYSTTSQYGRVLNARNGTDATATVRGVLNGLATRTRQQTATAGPLGTADARVYATVTAQAGPSATASATSAQGTATSQAMLAALTKVTTGTPTLNDPLSGNGQGNVWDTGYLDNNNTGCNFVSSSYQVLEAFPGFLRPCFADATNFRNLVYQVSMTLHSNCGGGLIVRGNKSADKYYLFTINTEGVYQFEVYAGNNHAILLNGTSSAILGTEQANTLTVMANQGVFDLFINQTFVAETISGQLSAGQIGVAVYNTNQPASASFSNAEVWKI